VKFCAVLKMKKLSDYVKFLPTTTIHARLLHVVKGDQLIDHERLQKEDRAYMVREPSEKQLEFARYNVDIKTSMLGNRGRSSC
jgi:hypothetical protein